MDSEMLTFWTYAAYLATSFAVTVWVASVLSRNGHHFLLDAFRHNELLAKAVNQLLVVGFYLINFGYVCSQVATDTAIASPAKALEAFAQKLGWVLLVLGVMHFFNLYVINRYRKRSVLEMAPPPVAPDFRLEAKDTRGAKG